MLRSSFELPVYHNSIMPSRRTTAGFEPATTFGAIGETWTLNPCGIGFLGQCVYHSTTIAFITWYGWWESNPHAITAPASETSMSTFPTHPHYFITMVPKVGVEPTRLSAGDSKSPVYYQFHHLGISYNLVRIVGFEPTCLSALVFETSMSALPSHPHYFTTLVPKVGLEPTRSRSGRF